MVQAKFEFRKQIVGQRGDLTKEVLHSAGATAAGRATQYGLPPRKVQLPPEAARSTPINLRRQTWCPTKRDSD